MTFTVWAEHLDGLFAEAQTLASKIQRLQDCPASLDDLPALLDWRRQALGLIDAPCDTKDLADALEFFLQPLSTILGHARGRLRSILMGIEGALAAQSDTLPAFIAPHTLKHAAQILPDDHGGRFVAVLIDALRSDHPLRSLLPRDDLLRTGAGLVLVCGPAWCDGTPLPDRATPWHPRPWYSTAAAVERTRQARQQQRTEEQRHREASAQRDEERRRDREAAKSPEQRIAELERQLAEMTAIAQRRNGHPQPQESTT